MFAPLAMLPKPRLPLSFLNSPPNRLIGAIERSRLLLMRWSVPVARSVRSAEPILTTIRRASVHSARAREASAAAASLDMGERRACGL